MYWNRKLAKQLYEDHYCRDCVRDVYSLSLHGKDFSYRKFRLPCSRCGQLRGIVKGVSLFGQLKLLRQRNKTDTPKQDQRFKHKEVP